MKHRGKPDLEDRLAAEYVLGTLRFAARRRFQAWMRDDAALRITVTDWEERLTPMAASVPDVAPPARVWSAIEKRIAGSPRVTAPAAPPAVGWWDSLNFWRNLGLVTTGCALALVVGNMIRSPQIIEREVERIVVREVESSTMQPSYIAMLENETGEPVFMAYAARKSDELWVKSMALAPLERGRVYELWGIPPQPGMPPKSLGLVPAAEKGTIKLAAVADQSLADFPRLAISLEPTGGSRTGLPTGPIMYKGDCHKFW
jgi:anti-sigma-K factor RskA